MSLLFYENRFIDPFIGYIRNSQTILSRRPDFQNEALPQHHAPIAKFLTMFFFSYLYKILIDLKSYTHTYKHTLYHNNTYFFTNIFPDLSALRTIFVCSFSRNFIVGLLYWLRLYANVKSSSVHIYGQHVSIYFIILAARPSFARLFNKKFKIKNYNTPFYFRQVTK